MTLKDKYSIDYQGLAIGIYNYEINISDDLFTLWEESEVKKGDLKAEIELAKHNNMMELNIQINGEVEVTCDRCLENFMMPIKYKGQLIVKISTEPGEDDADIIWLNPADDHLPLAQYIYESIILSLPYTRVHPLLEECNQDMLNRFTIIDNEELEEQLLEGSHPKGSPIDEEHIK